MTDSTKMVDLPWIDDTTRTVPEWTPYVDSDGYLAFAREGGYSCRCVADSHPFDHDDDTAAVRILTDAPEPPVKVTVPTGIGAIVSSQWYPDRPVFVLDHKGWCGLVSGRRYEVSEIANEIRKGARVLYEGSDE